MMEKVKTWLLLLRSMTKPKPATITGANTNLKHHYIQTIKKQTTHLNKNKNKNKNKNTKTKLRSENRERKRREKLRRERHKEEGDYYQFIIINHPSSSIDQIRPNRIQRRKKKRKKKVEGRNMSGRVSSSPNLLPLSINAPTEDVVSLEGIATNVKLLLKLIQDHQEASNKGTLDDRKTQRFAGMMTILDDVRTRLQKCQFSGKKVLPELRRCSTDLKATMSNPPSPRDHSSKKINETLVLDEKEKLRKDLNASYAAQKRLGVMCASLGKEKDIIARELTRKVQELNEMEELVNDLKAQNEKLSTKVQACVAEHKEVKKSSQGSSEVHQAALQQRNRELSEQLVKSLEGYKSLKRKLKEAQDARQGMQVALDGIGEAIEVGTHQIRSLKERVSENSLGEQASEIKEKIAILESVFKRIEAKVSKYRHQGRQ